MSGTSKSRSTASTQKAAPSSSRSSAAKSSGGRTSTASQVSSSKSSQPAQSTPKKTSSPSSAREMSTAAASKSPSASATKQKASTTPVKPPSSTPKQTGTATTSPKTSSATSSKPSNSTTPQKSKSTTSPKQSAASVSKTASKSSPNQTKAAPKRAPKTTNQSSSSTANPVIGQMAMLNLLSSGSGVEQEPQISPFLQVYRDHLINIGDRMRTELPPDDPYRSLFMSAISPIYPAANFSQYQPSSTGRSTNDSSILDSLDCYYQKQGYYVNKLKQISHDFVEDKPDRRDGNKKDFYNYVLLDSRKCANKSYVDWGEFRDAIFYIGKGKGSRASNHTRDADKWLLSSKDDSGARDKNQKIEEIWRSGGTVMILEIPDKIKSEEAHTKEALMIDGMGLGRLCNRRHGSYYESAKDLPVEDKQKLGLSLLVNARKLFIQNGSVEVRPKNLKVLEDGGYLLDEVERDGTYDNVLEELMAKLNFFRQS